VRDSGDMDELSLDDLDGLFGDDGPIDTDSTDPLEIGSANNSFEFFEPLETPSAIEASLSQVDSVCASLAPISSEPHRRRNSHNGKAPAADWHSEAADRTHRQRMIHEV
jgi:hypothetical protein